MLVSGIEGSCRVVVEGHVIETKSAAEGISVMNIPMRADVVELDVVVFLVNRARNKLFGVLDAAREGGVRQKLAMLDKVVLGTVRWALGVVWPVTNFEFHSAVLHFPDPQPQT